MRGTLVSGQQRSGVDTRLSLRDFIRQASEAATTAMRHSAATAAGRPIQGHRGTGGQVRMAGHPRGLNGFRQ